MPDCPLALAAADAPNLIAISSKQGSFTFKELDTYVTRLQLHVDEGDCLQLPAEPTVAFLATLFAVWRKNASVFPINSKLPQIPKVENAPPRSLLLLTSGSTGSPKIAVLSLENLLYNALGALKPLDLRPHDRWRLTLPLYHVGGIGIVIRCILARSTIVLDDDPLTTHLSYVPTQLYRSTPLYKNLRCLLLGGAPVLHVPKNLPVFVTYGLTEMGSMVTVNGSVLADRELQLTSEGEIEVRGKCLFQKYLGEKEQTGWFATKDLGKITDGKLTVLGRKDWMFISGGENIQPEEIERQILLMPGVVEAIVVGKTDPEFGKRPVAVVEAQTQFTYREMNHFLRERLPKYKIPIELYFLEEIPRKTNFKINRFIIEQYINNK